MNDKEINEQYKMFAEMFKTRRGENELYFFIIGFIMGIFVIGICFRCITFLL